MREGSEDFSPQEYKAFYKKHPQWPWIFKIKNQYEKRLGSLSARDVLAFFKEQPPKSLEGALAFIKAHKAQGNQKKARQAAKASWIHVPFKTQQAQEYIKSAGTFLTEEDHYKRARYWLGREDLEAALSGVKGVKNPAKGALLKAQVALLKGDKNARSLYQKAKTHFKKDPELQLGYLSWLRRTHNDYAPTYLLRHPEMVRHAPERSWRNLHILFRRALEKGNRSLATKLIKAHQLKPSDEGYFEAEWLKAWLVLRHDQAPLKALALFETGFQGVSTPISKGRFAFWSGVAAEKAGRLSLAQSWYKRAGAYPESFYGQQGLRKLGFQKVPSLPSLTASKKEVDQIKNKDLYRAAQALLEAGHPAFAQNFLHMLMKSTTTESEERAVLKAVQTLSPDHLLGLAKETKPERRLYYKELYPVLSKDHQKAYRAVDSPLLHAVIRKESLFDPRLVSWAGARGLSQLVPETAQEIAKAHKIKFNKKKLLNEPSYNTRLGAAYLKTRLDKFEGHQPLALIAYNAGLKYSYEWQDMFGDPRHKSVDLLDWMESLPFGETRNYLHRVLEGQMIYRCVLNKQCSKMSLTQGASFSHDVPRPGKKPKHRLSR